MTVKICKHGPAAYTTSCAKCGSGFSYELNDLLKDFMWGADYVPCPKCGARHKHPDQRPSR